VSDGGAPADAAARAALEKFRQSGIRIDREGVFWHEGAVIEHPRIVATFRRWLDRLPPPDGRHVLRLDDTRYVFVDCDDAPLLARSLRWDGDRAWLMLAGGDELELEYAKVRLDPARGSAAYAAAQGRPRLEVRLAPQAWSQLCERVSEAEGGGGAPVLDAHGQRWPISLR